MVGFGTCTCSRVVGGQSCITEAILVRLGPLEVGEQEQLFKCVSLDWLLNDSISYVSGQREGILYRTVKYTPSWPLGESICFGQSEY